MKKLTAKQIEAIQTLSQHPLIYSTDLEFFNNGLSRVTIKSAVGAEWKDVDTVLTDALDKLFGNLDYHGPSVKEHNPLDGTDSEYYFMDWDGESFLCLIMRYEPSDEWSIEDILRREA